MDKDPISNELRAFLASHIGSVEQLEILLFLFAHSNEFFTADIISKRLYISGDSAKNRLESFLSDGLVEKQTETYRFHPNEETANRIVRDLDRLYKERRVAVVNAIFSNPNQYLSSFADAFKFKK